MKAVFEAWAVETRRAYRDQHGLWFYRNGGDGLFDAWQAAINLAVSRCLVAPVKTGRQDQREACANAIRAGS